MKRPQSTIAALTRLSSVGMLALWVTAVAHCTTNCCCDDAHSNPTSSHPAVTAPPLSSHHAKQPVHHDPGFCDSLHSVCPIFPSTAMVRPDFGPADKLNLVSSDSATILTQPETLIRRQPPDRHGTCAPEVCLGPALHSLAPPVSSLS